MNAHQIGVLGELEAQRLLTEKGYKILATNYLIRYGEADIVAYYKNSLVFIEVKSRSNDAFGQPIEALTPKKVKALLGVMKEYERRECFSGYVRLKFPFFNIRYKKHYNKVRLDVVEVFFSKSGEIIRTAHTEDFLSKLEMEY